MKKTLKIFIYITPILVMIGLIPFIQNDYKLTLVYIGIIIVSFVFIKQKKTNIIIFLFGFFSMIVSEYLFISTGVEVFLRNSLFGLMPLWLPFLWALAFVVMGRSIEILKNQ